MKARLQLMRDNLRAKKAIYAEDLAERRANVGEFIRHWKTVVLAMVVFLILAVGGSSLIWMAMGCCSRDDHIFAANIIQMWVTGIGVTGAMLGGSVALHEMLAKADLAVGFGPEKGGVRINSDSVLFPIAGFGCQGLGAWASQALNAG